MDENETRTLITATVEGGERVPRIYVASLADYNAGRLHGRWIDANVDVGEVFRQINEMLSESAEPNAEEWAIHDHENFAGLRIAESEDLGRVVEVAKLCQEHGPVFAKLVEYFGGMSGIEEAKERMEEGYRGAYDRLEDYVQQLVEDCYGDVLKPLPDFLRYHFDYDGLAHDMELNGDLFTLSHDGQVHVFESR